MLLGLIGGVLAKHTRILPQMSGYVLVGLLLGTIGFGKLSIPLINIINVFIDICLGLILFELGKTFNIRWTKYDRSMLVYGSMASLVAFACMYALLLLLNISSLNSLLISVTCITSSPSIIFMIAKEQNYDGPVVRRTKNLLVINNLIGAIMFILIMPYLHYKSNASLDEMLFKPAIYLLGSLATSIVMYIFTLIFAYILRKNQYNQYIMQTAMLSMIIGITYLFNFSIVLNLLFYGMLISNCNYRNLILNIEFKKTEYIFFILLFVSICAILKWTNLKMYITTVILLILVRSAGQFIITYIGLIRGKYTKKQSILVSAALTPIGAITYWMTKSTSSTFPSLVSDAMNIISLAILLMQIIGPIITYWAFKIAEMERPTEH